MNSTGKSPGLTLRKNGGVVISTGSRRCATVERGLHVERRAVDVAVEVELDGDLASCRAPTSRSSTMMPAMVENCRSIGAATEAAIVSGLAPGSVAVTWMVGKSTARQRRDRQQPVGEDAEHDERRRDQRRHHRAADADFGNASCQDSGLAAADRDAGAVGQQQLAVGDHDVSPSSRPDSMHGYAVDASARP